MFSQIHDPSLMLGQNRKSHRALSGELSTDLRHRMWRILSLRVLSRYGAGREIFPRLPRRPDYKLKSGIDSCPTAATSSIKFVDSRLNRWHLKEWGRLIEGLTRPWKPSKCATDLPAIITSLAGVYKLPHQLTVSPANGPGLYSIARPTNSLDATFEKRGPRSRSGVARSHRRR